MVQAEGLDTSVPDTTTSSGSSMEQSLAQIQLTLDMNAPPAKGAMMNGAREGMAVVLGSSSPLCSLSWTS